MKYSLMLGTVGLKYKNKLLMPSVEEGYKSILESTLPNELEKIYIEEDVFSNFLTYNYQSYIYSSNKDYALNILNPRNATSFKKYKLIIESSKYDNYLLVKKKHVVENLSSNENHIPNLETFKKLVEESLSNNIFNIEINKYLTKFNTILDVQSTRFYFSFEYNRSKRTIRLITAY